LISLAVLLYLVVNILAYFWQWLLLILVILLIYKIGISFYSKHYQEGLAVNTSYKKEDFESDNVKKGNDFESYVVSLFPESEFTIVEWTTDIMRKHNRYVEADTRPDLLIRHDASGQEFYVECKYRSYAFEDKISWSNNEQLTRYKNFADTKGIPFFVVIGIGGSATWPEDMFCLSINDAKWPELYLSYAKKFWRNPQRKFYITGTAIY